MSLTKTPLKASVCKGCNKTVYFAKDEHDKTQILDGTPPVFVQIRDGDDGQQQVMRVTGYVSHFATCPHANEFSRSKQPLRNAAEGETCAKTS